MSVYNSVRVFHNIQIRDYCAINLDGAAYSCETIPEEFLQYLCYSRELIFWFYSTIPVRIGRFKDKLESRKYGEVQVFESTDFINVKFSVGLNV